MNPTISSRHQAGIRMSGLAPKSVRLSPNRINPGLFQIRFQYILAPGLKTDLKNPGFVLYCNNLPHFRVAADFPGTRHQFAWPARWSAGIWADPSSIENQCCPLAPSSGQLGSPYTAQWMPCSLSPVTGFPRMAIFHQISEALSRTLD